MLKGWCDATEHSLSLTTLPTAESGSGGISVGKLKNRQSFCKPQADHVRCDNKRIFVWNWKIHKSKIKTSWMCSSLKIRRSAEASWTTVGLRTKFTFKNEICILNVGGYGVWKWINTLILISKYAANQNNANCSHVNDRSGATTAVCK